jgi:hypothetical protein
MYYFSCPCCTSNTRFYRVHRESASSGTGLSIFIFGGLLASLIFLGREHRTRVQCAHCGYVFVRPSLGQSPIATGATLIVCCGLLTAAVAGILAYAGILADLPGWSYVLRAGERVKEHPEVATAAAIACLVSTFALAGLLALFGNWRHHRAIRAKFDCEPTEFPSQPEREPAQSPEHCPNCGYNFTGNTSGKCPECGRAFAAT